MICPACGSSSEASRICPGCGTELPDDAPPSSAPPLEPRPAEVDPPTDPAAARCPLHPELLALGTCRRCGRFVCTTCVPGGLERREVVCPGCEERELRAEAPKRLRRYHRELVGSFLGLATIILVVPIIVYASGFNPKISVGLLVMATPLAVLLTVATIVFGMTRKRPFAWVAAGLEALVLVPLFLINPSPCNAVLVAAPIFSVVRLLQMAELQRLLARPA